MIVVCSSTKHREKESNIAGKMWTKLDACYNVINIIFCVSFFLPGALKVFIFGTEAALLDFLIMLMLFLMWVNNDLGGGGGGGGISGIIVSSVWKYLYL